MSFSRFSPPRAVESPEAAASRIVDAIAELVTRESVLLRSGDCVRASAESKRVAPLISRLSELAADYPSAVDRVRGRVGDLLAVRRESYGLLGGLRLRLVAERSRLAEARRRLQTLAPVYSVKPVARPRLSRLNASV